MMGIGYVLPKQAWPETVHKELCCAYGRLRFTELCAVELCVV